MYLRRIFLFVVLTFTVFKPAFGQEDLYTIKGKVKGASIRKLFIADQFSIDPVTHRFCYPDVDERTESRLIEYAADESFTMKNVKLEKDRTLFTIVNEDSTRGAFVDVATASAKQGIIDVGIFRLEDFHAVRGRIDLPSFISVDDIQQLNVLISRHNADNSLSYVGYVDLLNQSPEFEFNLPTGSYTLFFDLQDGENNYRRVIKQIDVDMRGYSFRDSVVISTPLDEMVRKKLPLKDVLKLLSTESFSRTEKTSLDRIIAAQGPVLVYFFAGYCVPCFSENGLRKYFQEAAEYRTFSVIGIHSDSYKIKSCPQNSSEMNLYMGKNNPWKRLRKDYNDAQQKLQNQPKNPAVLLTWQPANISEKLAILGYPTAMVFDKGVLIKWFMGVNPLISETLESLATK